MPMPRRICEGFAATLCLISALASAQDIHQMRRHLRSDERVSIYDGTLPSPELGPHSPPPSAAMIQPAETLQTVTEIGHRCNSGCVAGSVIGSTVGFCLLVAAVFFCCKFCRRRQRVYKDERSLSQIDLLASGEGAKQPEIITSKPKQTFCAGSPIFCQIGKCCASGSVIGAEGEEYRVRLCDGSEKTVKDVSLAMNYEEGSTVLYTDPKGGKSFTGTIVASNGNFWPPFYQLKPQNLDGTINTTAQCLAPAHKL